MLLEKVQRDHAPSFEERSGRGTIVSAEPPPSPVPVAAKSVRRNNSLTERRRAAPHAIKFLANKLRISIVAAGTHEALHVMRADPQIASRFEQLELPVWTESQELASQQPGYLGAESARCPDGFGITGSYFDSAEAIGAWA
ncbi:MAG TPA: TniB family NTP-binding protein [Rhizomicrobium sp.]|nr:TniB family NTP-binding protein [Rhizomicrobium sp.]